MPDTDTTYASELRSARCEAALNAQAADRFRARLNTAMAAVRAVELVCANVVDDAAKPGCVVADAIQRIRNVVADVLQPLTDTLPQRDGQPAVTEAVRAVATVHIHMARCGGGPGCTGPNDTDQERADRLLAALQAEEAMAGAT